MTVFSLSWCATCTRIQGNTCTAYPDGIPDKILHDGADHRTPLPGDNGITYQPNESLAALREEMTPYLEELTYDHRRR